MGRTFVRLMTGVLVLGALTPAVAALGTWSAWGDGPGGMQNGVVPMVTAALLALAILASLLGRRLLAHPAAGVDGGSAQDEAPDCSIQPLVGWGIALSAGAALFLELAVIRLQASMLPVFSFYKNLSLLACFAGLGLGYALAKRVRIPVVLSPLLLGWQALLMTVLNRLADLPALLSIQATPVSEQMNMGYSVAGSQGQYAAIYWLLASMFLLTALAFVPIGQLCGRLMDRRPALPAYGLNLAGSIAGVAAMMGLSALWTGPVVWFAVGLGVLLLFQATSRKSLRFGVWASAAVVGILAWPGEKGVERIHSPYQLLERSTSSEGTTQIRAAGLFYQYVFDPAKRAGEHGTRAQYDFPYKLAPRNDRVAVVGAGTGNDVAAALRAGAGRVDAVEIDPAIIELGRRHHPERPYDDPRVTAIADDARSFLRTSDDEYDLIVYGLLDSHGLLSHASSVRLDSFVYTVEGLREARARLAPDGVLYLSFCMLSDEIGGKIYAMMRDAFDGHPPIVIDRGSGGVDAFVQRKDGGLAPESVAALTDAGEAITDAYVTHARQIDVSTDDWPFFYMPRRVYPFSYLAVLGLVVVLSGSLNAVFLKARPRYSHLAFLFLGAGFMLVETKAITELGLTFGNTWQVIGVVIIGVLTMAFAANAVVHKIGLAGTTIPYVLLLLSLVGGWWISSTGGFATTTAGRIGALVVLTGPMFFSGMIFSTLLRSSGAVPGAMAMNLLGAMLGGVLEYNSMYFGFRSLYVLAGVLYGLAWLSGVRVRGRVRTTSTVDVEAGAGGPAMVPSTG